MYIQLLMTFVKYMTFCVLIHTVIMKYAQHVKELWLHISTR